MFKRTLFFGLILPAIYSLPFSTKTPIITTESLLQPTTLQPPLHPVYYQNNTRVLVDNNEKEAIEDIVQKQADTIKKIVTDQQKKLSIDTDSNPLADGSTGGNLHAEYPVLTRFSVEQKERLRQEVERMTLEEIKEKCQHLSKLLGSNYFNQSRIPVNHNFDNEKVLIETRRPINGFYITNKPNTKPTVTPTITKSTPKTTTTKPPTKKSQNNIKYIKLEPVILQKTILSDGRTIYYWHKSLPSAVEIKPPVYHHLSNTYSTVSSTTPSTTTTTPKVITTTAYSGYDFRNLFFPSFYSSNNFEANGNENELEKSNPTSITISTTSTTTPSTTTTSTTTEKITSHTSEEIMYAHQLKFVVPVPYGNIEENGNVGVGGANAKMPWDFDQFAYYPKQLQPETMNIKVPYSPTFHMIKAVAVPEKYKNTYAPADMLNNSN